MSVHIEMTWCELKKKKEKSTDGFQLVFWDCGSNLPANGMIGGW